MSWPSLLRLTRWSFLPLAASVVVGCASMGDGDPFDKIITKDTDLYQTGSNESVTERHLESGTRVRITGMSGDGKMEVQTVSGDKGFVDRDAVGDPPGPAPANQNGN